MVVILPSIRSEYMNWRRGSNFTAIHLAVAIPLIVYTLVPRYNVETIHSSNPSPTFQLTEYQEGGQTVEFSPICEEWRSVSWQEKVLTSSELPAMILSGWNSDCPARWTSSGLIGIDMKHHTRSMAVASSSAFCLLIAVQWMFVGGIPLIKPRRWWLEPGAFNTVLTLIAVFSAAMGNMLERALGESLLLVFGILVFVAALLASLTWIAWLALLMWTILKLSWKFARSSREPTANS